jgi:hypothetical protein
MPTQKEYLDAAMARVCEFSKSAGQELWATSCTAIYMELKTMYDVGVSQSFSIRPLVWDIDGTNLVGVCQETPLFHIRKLSARKGYKLESELPGYRLRYFQDVDSCKEAADAALAAYLSQFLDTSK